MQKVVPIRHTCQHGPLAAPRLAHAVGTQTRIIPGTIVPMCRPGFLMDGDAILAIEVHAMVYDPAEGSTHYLATFRGGVAKAAIVDGDAIVWSEGDALKVRAARARVSSRSSVPGK